MIWHGIAISQENGADPIIKTAEIYSVDEGKETLDGRKVFNEKGNLIEEVKYKWDGSISVQTINEYDGDRLIIETHHRTDYKGNPQIDSYEHESNAQGLTLAKRHTRNGELKGVSDSYTYTTDGLIRYWSRYKSDGNEYQKFIFHYDELGQKVKKEVYYGTELFSWTTYKYDALGRIIIETKYDPEDGKRWVLENKYDEHGSCIEIQSYEGEEEKPAGGTKLSYRYDDAGNWVYEESRSVQEAFGRTAVTVKESKRKITYW